MSIAEAARRALEDQRVLLEKVSKFGRLTLALLEVIEHVPDPEQEGYCESCGTRLNVVEVTKPLGYKAYVFQHKETCWYGRLQSLISKIEGGWDGRSDSGNHTAR